jgi:hypothetical protein
MDVPWRPSIQSMIEAIATIFFPEFENIMFRTRALPSALFARHRFF